MHHSSCPWLLLPVLLLPVGIAHALQQGEIDPVFGNTIQGVQTNFDTSATTGTKSSDEALSMLLRDDGGVVVVGRTDSSSGDVLRIAHYQSNGSLDTGFCGTGLKSVETNLFGFHVAMVLPDGKILVAGSDDDSGALDGQFIIQRYLADGTPDTSFSGDGEFSDNLTSGSDRFTALTVQSDGKIIAVGSSSIGSPATNVVVYRLNDDGTPDNSFNGTGHISVSAGTGASELLTSGAVAITPDNNILVGGGVDSAGLQAFFLLRLTSSGAVDTSFSATGFKTYTTTASGQFLRFYINALAIESTGRITAGGYVYHLVYSNSAESNNPALFRTDASGTLDTGFGSILQITSSPPKYKTSAYINSLMVLADGSVIAVGHQETSPSGTAPTNFQTFLAYTGGGSFIDGTSGFDGNGAQGGGLWNSVLPMVGTNAMFATGTAVTSYTDTFGNPSINRDFLTVRIDLGTLDTNNAVGGAGSHGAGATLATLACNSGSNGGGSGSGSTGGTSSTSSGGGGGLWTMGTLCIFALAGFALRVGIRARKA